MKGITFEPGFIVTLRGRWCLLAFTWFIFEALASSFLTSMSLYQLGLLARRQFWAVWYLLTPALALAFYAIDNPQQGRQLLAEARPADPLMSPVMLTGGYIAMVCLVSAVIMLGEPTKAMQAACLLNMCICMGLMQYSVRWYWAHKAKGR